MREMFLAKKLVFFMSLAVGMAMSAGAQTEGPVGEFTGQASVGDDAFFGEAHFNNGVYEILGSGSDIWGSADGFYWAFQEVTGNFVMTADLEWGDQDVPGGGPTAGDVWKKLGLMVRNDPEDPTSAYIFAMLRNDLAGDLQYRLETGGSAANAGEVAKGGNETNRVQLIRLGDKFIMQRGLSDGSFRKFGEIDAPNIEDAALVGLAVTAHNVANLERGLFSNVTIESLQDVAAVDIVRSFDNDILDQGATATVTLTVDIEEGKTSDVVITENVPSLVSASDVNASAGTAQISGSQITWNLTGASGTETLTYTVTAPASGVGVGSFSGNANVGDTLTFGTGGSSFIGVRSASSDKTVYFFRNVGTVSASDDKMILDLQIYFGVSIVQFDDTNAAGFEMPGVLDDADAAYASETVNSGNYANQQYHILDAVPQMTGEQALHDDFAFQAGTGNGNYLGNTIEIVNNDHFITQGFDLGPLQITNGDYDIARLDNPPEGVTVLATAVGNPNRAVLWLIEEGDTVNGTTAPAIRIANWLQGRDGYVNATPEGQQIILNGFAYMLDEPKPNIVGETLIKEFMLY